MHPRLGQVWCEMVGDVVLSNVMNIFPIVSNIWPSVAFLSPLPARGSAHMFSPSHQQGGKRSYHYLPYAGIHIGASVWYSHPVLYRRYVLKCEIFFLYSCLTLLFCATATSTVENETFCSSPLPWQIRSRNKYFVFYWQTQVFDEEKVNHYMNNLYKQMLLSNLFSFFATASKVSRCSAAEEGAVESRWCSLYQMSKNYKCCIKEWGD